MEANPSAAGTWPLLLPALLLMAHGTAAAQALPAAGAAVGRDAAVTPVPGGLQVRFLPAEWPNAVWAAPEGRAWDWHTRATLAFDAQNPGDAPLDFSVRIDDDPGADGVHHCRTAYATLAPGGAGAFRIDLAAADPMSAEGMRAGPPTPGGEGLTLMRGSGEIDPAHVVAFQFFTHQPAGPRTLRVTRLRLLPSPAEPERYRGIVDAFGQYAHADWPGKVHTEAELAADRATEGAALAAAPAQAGRDAYGGWADGPDLPASGFFTTARRDGRWWLVTPTGHLFLSFGLDAVSPEAATIVHPRDALFTWLPGPGDPLAKHFGTDGHTLYGPHKSGRTFDFYAANLERKYGAENATAWRDRTLARLKSWGFNTIGNWSSESLEAAHKIPYTATLGVNGPHARLSSGSDYWGPMHDPFDPQFAADCEAAFRDKATHLRDDPWCLGYFVDNELSWSGGDVDGGRYGLAYGALAAPAAPAGQSAKRAFRAQLQARYGTVERFNTAWGASLTAWTDLDAPFQAAPTPGGAQKSDMAAFVHDFARRYFTVVRDTLRKYDPNHLYLGCRFAEGAPADAVRACAEVCDVVSLNVYRPQLDAATLQKSWGWTDDLNKPCLIGEFHVGALDRGLFHPGLVAAPNQTARAATFRRYVESVVDQPAFVGAHWFEYVDEPLAGRSLDGENYNIGFVSVTDTPYPEMVVAARQVFAQVYPRHAGPALHASKRP